MPAISVIMAVYNGTDFIKESIDSILDQSFTDFEFIIVNDGSTDDSLNIIEKYSDKRIKVINNETNIGLPKSLNKAIRLSKGKFIARQDADDISNKFRLEKQYNKIVSSQYDLISSDCHCIDVDSNITGLAKPRFKNKNKIQHLLTGKMIFPHGSVLFKKNIVDIQKCYNENFYYAQDAELWLRLLKLNYNFFHFEEPLYMLRRTPLFHDKKIVGQSSYIQLLKENIDMDSRGIIFEKKVSKLNSILLNRDSILLKNNWSEYYKNCAVSSLLELNDKEKFNYYLKKAMLVNQSFLFGIRLFLTKYYYKIRN